MKTLNDKIRSILNEGVPGTEKKPEVQSMDAKGQADKKEQPAPEGGSDAAGSLKPNPSNGDASQPKQGDSMAVPAAQDIAGDETGKKAASAASKQPVPTNSGAGAAPNFSTVADAQSVINQASSKGNVWHEGLEADAELIEQVEAVVAALAESVELSEEQLDELKKSTLASYAGKAAKSQRAASANVTYQKDQAAATKSPAMKAAHGDAAKLADKTVAKRNNGIANAASKLAKEDVDAAMGALFTEDMSLSEDFRTKAAGLFEAVVVAKATEIAEALEAEMVEEAAQAIVAERAELVEKLDSYLNYVTERWLEENKVAVQSGIKAQVTEGFINGLRTLFAEHYIEVPDEKHDVLGEMQAEKDALQAKVDESIAESVELAKQVRALKRTQIVAQVSEGLAATQAEKLASLTESVTFEDEASFAAKVQAVRASTFGGGITRMQRLEEQVDSTSDETRTLSSTMEVYTKALGNAPRFTK